MIDTNELGEGLRGLVPLLIGAGIVALIVAVILAAVMAKLIGRMLRSRQGRAILTALTGSAVLVAAGIFVVANLATAGEAWLILGGILVFGLPLGWWAATLLIEDDDDWDDSDPIAVDPGETPPSIWR